MSIIAVENVPQKVGLRDIVKDLSRPVHGPFEALNFERSNNSSLMKVCYLRLSERVDPVRAVQNINTTHYRSRGKYFAYIPEKVPHIPLGLSKKAKKRRAPLAMRQQMHIADLNAEGRIVKYTTDELVSELQAKYPGIYSLSKKYDHKLLHEITKIIHNRVEVLLQGSPELEESCFKATRGYRRAHPHFGDFQLVLSTLHAIQDAAGTPREQLQESDISTYSAMHRGLDVPVERVKSLCDRYTSRILNKMNEHVNGLDSMISQIDFEEEIARKQVRQELKKLQPFLSVIVAQVVSKQFLPPEGKMHKMRIYGEPFLPNKETMMPFLARFKPRRPMRSMRMFNMLKLSVSPVQYHQLIAMNGTVLSGAKLLIGCSDVIMFKASQFSTVDGAVEGEGAAEGGSEDEHGDEEQEEQDEQEEQEDYEDMEMEL